MAKQRQQRRQEAKTTRATQQAAQAQRRQRNAWVWRGAIVVLAIVIAVVGYRWYQTRDLLKDVEARYQWVEPDLKPLPELL